MPKKKRKAKSAPIVSSNDDDNQAEEEETTAVVEKPGMGATPASNRFADNQLDSDDDEYCKRNKPPLQDAELRKERKRLYELQEAKRRVRNEEWRSKKTVDGETPLSRKVKRLKSERHAILQEYKDTGGSIKKNNKKKKKRSAGIPLPK